MFNQRKWEVLTEWILDVFSDMELRKQTYFRTIAIINAYSKQGHNTEKLQTVAAAAMMIAIKQDETRREDGLPAILSGYTAGSSKTWDIIEMEIDILETIGWFTAKMTSYEWLQLKWENDDTLITKNEQEVLEELLIYSTIDEKTKNWNPRERAEALIDIIENREGRCKKKTRVYNLYKRFKSDIKRATSLDFKNPHKTNDRFYKTEEFGKLLQQRWRMGKSQK